MRKSATSHDGQPMRAALFRQYGSAEKLHVETVSRPACGSDQVLIHVRAAGINPLDWRIRSGAFRWLLPARFPVIPGFDVAGDIVEVGGHARSEGWNIGDRVFAFLDARHGGGYAEFAAARTRVLAAMPASLTYEEAASTPLAATTALRALRDLAQLQAGQQLLINGASGGVGTFAVQLGKFMGAHVTGVCSADNLDCVRRIGADRVIDYRREDFTATTRQLDVIFDVAAKSSYWKCRRVLNSRGTYIRTIPTPSSVFFQLVTQLTQQSVHNVMVRPCGEDLKFIAGLFDTTDLRVVVDQVLPLDRAAEAHQLSETGHVRGKLVLSTAAETK